MREIAAGLNLAIRDDLAKSMGSIEAAATKKLSAISAALQQQLNQAIVGSFDNVKASVMNKIQKEA